MSSDVVGWVIVGKVKGILLGNSVEAHLPRRLLWSKDITSWGSFEPTAALTFAALADALDFTAANTLTQEQPVDFVLLTPDVVHPETGRLFATPAACELAGLQPWITSSTEPSNTLPI
jgi:hypothetical protein